MNIRDKLNYYINENKDPVNEEQFDFDFSWLSRLVKNLETAIGKVKKEYGEELCLIGNIDCGELLSRREAEAVEKEVKKTIDRAADGGGYILASSNEIHASVKPENFMRMIKTAKKYGQYTK